MTLQSRAIIWMAMHSLLLGKILALKFQFIILVFYLCRTKIEDKRE